MHVPCRGKPLTLNCKPLILLAFWPRAGVTRVCPGIYHPASRAAQSRRTQAPQPPRATRGTRARRPAESRQALTGIPQTACRADVVPSWVFGVPEPPRRGRWTDRDF